MCIKIWNNIHIICIKKVEKKTRQLNFHGFLVDFTFEMNVIHKGESV